MTSRRYRRRPGCSAHRSGVLALATATNSKRSSRHRLSRRRASPMIRTRCVRPAPSAQRPMPRPNRVRPPARASCRCHPRISRKPANQRNCRRTSRSSWSTIPRREPAGTLVIDTPNTYLYLVLGGGKAMRYGIGVGRDGFTWTGTERISRMKEWPDWFPPSEMIDRQPYLPRMMAGGPGNPLGARALYLGHTLYRIHGTNQPSTIGSFVSSGCIRLLNEDIEDLYSRVQVGTRVVVLPGGKPPEHVANTAAQPPANGLPPAGVPHEHCACQSGRRQLHRDLVRATAAGALNPRQARPTPLGPSLTAELTSLTARSGMPQIGASAGSGGGNGACAISIPIKSAQVSRWRGGRRCSGQPAAGRCCNRRDRTDTRRTAAICGATDRTDRRRRNRHPASDRAGGRHAEFRLHGRCHQVARYRLCPLQSGTELSRAA